MLGSGILYVIYIWYKLISDFFMKQRCDTMKQAAYQWRTVQICPTIRRRGRYMNQAWASDNSICFW
jgi:hypothetical protein